MCREELQKPALRLLTRIPDQCRCVGGRNHH